MGANIGASATVDSAGIDWSGLSVHVYCSAKSRTGGSSDIQHGEGDGKWEMARREVVETGKRLRHDHDHDHAICRLADLHGFGVRPRERARRHTATAAWIPAAWRANRLRAAASCIMIRKQLESQGPLPRPAVLAACAATRRSLHNL